MAKVGGLLQACWVGGYDLSGDVSALDTVQASRRPIDVTALNTTSHERIGGRTDGRIEATGHFNDAAARSHVVLSEMPTTDTQVIYCIGTTLGDPAAAMANAKQVSYSTAEKEDASLEVKMAAVSDRTGLEWGRLLTPGTVTHTEGTNGAPYDFGAETTFGLQAYLMVFALTGTNVVVTLQESSDNDADTYEAVTGGAFASVTSAPSFQRIATATDLTVEQYLRPVTTGTFTSATFAVVVVRNLAGAPG